MTRFPVVEVDSQLGKLPEENACAEAQERDAGYRVNHQVSLLDPMRSTSVQIGRRQAHALTGFSEFADTGLNCRIRPV
mgnify:CR=1 FL=1